MQTFLLLSKRFLLEFDMSAQKENSVSEENIDYLKGLKDEVTITVCAEEEGYTGGYMGYYAQNLYGVSSDASKYFEQTLKLLDKYPAYNNKITLKYVDTQGSEFTEISQKYSNEKLAYGDIIVSAKGSDNNERYKVLGFKDVYQLSEDNTYAAYGYSQSTVSGNSVETAVTSAIAYVTSSKKSFPDGEHFTSFRTAPAGSPSILTVQLVSGNRRIPWFMTHS